MKEIIKNSAGLHKKQVALIAPLDWGLGHATRCIPLIKRLSEQGFMVIIAAEGPQKVLLQQEFPDLTFADLPGYRLHYGRSARQTVFRLFLQIPKILISINREKRWLSRFLKKNQVTITISDNRYGFRHPSVKAIFITHQLYIKTPFGASAERFLQKLNYHFIEKFSECWVPDYRSENNLAGILSHPAKLPATSVTYIEPLTRCYKKEMAIQNELLIVLSGPEPQRTLLENLLLHELKDYHNPVMFVRGLPGVAPAESPSGDVCGDIGLLTSSQSLPKGTLRKETINSFNQIRFYNHLPSGELNDAINAAKLIIARSGYSTVMDIMQLDKPCVFIPTPGQSEQLYLAEYLAQKKTLRVFSPA
jgi:uncharacterized protein (TIGR00661 family)